MFYNQVLGRRGKPCYQHGCEYRMERDTVTR